MSHDHGIRASPPPTSMPEANVKQEAPVREPLVSVIIPCYNNAAFIRQTIDSVLRQTYPGTEVIVVDDASSDESWDLVREFGDALTAVRNDRNQGACYSRNRGAALASGEFLMFLDADDQIDPNTLRNLVGAINATGADLAAADWRFLIQSENGWVPAETGFSPQPPEGDFVRAWLSEWYVPPCALLWRRTAFEATGGWDQSLAANQDGDIVLRALLDGARIEKTSGGLGLYRKYLPSHTTISTSKSADAVDSRLRVFRRVEEKLERSGLLQNYQLELGQSYYSLARQAYLVDVRVARDAETRARTLAGKRATSGTLAHRVLASAIGLGRKERLAQSIRRGISGLRAAIR